MPRTLTLFPDTNLFIQCRPIEEIDWAEFAGFERIDLVVTRPVQVEIDRQKSKGNAEWPSELARLPACLVEPSSNRTTVSRSS